MEIILSAQTPINTPTARHKSGKRQKTVKPGRLEAILVWSLIKLRIFFWACIILKKPSTIYKVFRNMLQLRSNVWGGDLKKIYRNSGLYYFNQYTPGWPSRAYDQLIKSELRRRAAPATTRERLSFVFLAITRKCPMRCEHCFEWDNLNQKESFRREDLLQTIDLFQQEGVLQFHFSGGEPMVRYNDLLDLISHASKGSACWVLTSGFNVTSEKAIALKKAGCTGIVVSLDHYLETEHNTFRGHKASFQLALDAVRSAQEAGLMTSLSICVTKRFLDGGHLLPYLEFAHSLQVSFVQVLEPRSIGHYSGQEVHLEERHVTYLEEMFQQINHGKAYADFPTLLYHGYHQRRVGCFSGSRSVYVDSAGDVHACPFCHTKAYNMIDWVRSGATSLPEIENSCPRFGKIA